MPPSPYQNGPYPEGQRTQDFSHNEDRSSKASQPVETKPAFKTTEFIVYVVSVLAVLVASALADDSNGQPDVFTADKAWLFVTLLTIGYMVSRGLAKAGSRGNHSH